MLTNGSIGKNGVEKELYKFIYDTNFFRFQIHRDEILIFVRSGGILLNYFNLNLTLDES